MSETEKWIGAIQWATVEINMCPDDSISDIFTEAFEKYDLPYSMGNSKPYTIVKNGTN
jgi:hypothetical protein